MLKILRQKFGYDGSTLATVSALAVILFVVLIMPIAGVFQNALFAEDGFTLRFLTNVLDDPTFTDVLYNSFKLATLTTIATAVLTLPLALVNVRTRWRGKSLMSALLLVPMILPPFVGALGFRKLLGPYGTLNALLHDLNIVGPDFYRDWLAGHGFAAIVFLQALHLYPIMYLNLTASLANVDPSLEEAGRNLGAGGWTLFRRITLPLMLPGVFAGAILVFIWALTDMGTPLMFNYQDLIAPYIYNQRHSSDDGPTNALVLILLLTVAVLFFVARTVFGGRGHEMMARSVHVSNGRRLGRLATIGCWMLFGLVFVLAALPHVMVVLNSLAEVTEYDSWHMSILPQKLTLKYHWEALSNNVSLTSIRNSLFYSVSATAVCAVTAVFIARLLVRKKFVGRTLVDGMVMLPLAVPGVVLAFGYLFCYRDWGQWMVDRGFWNENYLYPETFPVVVLIIAYAVRRMPYMVRSAVAGMQQTSRTLEEAALNLGASPLRMLRRVAVPLVMANLVAGGILVFTFSMLEVSDSLMLAREKSYFPITTAIYDFAENAPDAAEGEAIASALGVWAMILLAVSLLVTSKLLGRKMGAIFRA